LERFDILYEDHRALLRLARALTEMTRNFVQSDRSALAQIRCDLAKRVSTHLLRETVIAVTPLRESPHPADQALARQYIGDLLAMRSESAAHHAKWSLQAALDDMPGYHASVRKLARGLADRITWEEAEIFPAAAALQAGSAEALAA
jgi:hypothetical protein